MSIMSDKWIRDMAENEGMIDPFEPKQVKQRDGKRILSYGTSSYGYDIRCAPEFKIFTNVNNALIDPKDFTDKTFVTVEADEIIIPPNSFILTRSVEYIRVPRDILIVCLGKSTLARCGVDTMSTPLEPEWEGHITLEFANTTSLPMKFYANEGCAQLLFFQGNEPCETSYKDRGGKYQGQRGITTPRT